jgi:hypothetical protein
MMQFSEKSVDWSPVSFSIRELWEFAKAQQLILRPDFQRRAVWNEAAQESLIDTVLRNLPMPKIFFATQTFTVEGSIRTKRLVIDGQQRLTALFHFLEGRFAIHDALKSGNKFHFAELSNELQNRINNYKIDANDIYSGNDELIREIYSRVNKYNIALNQQELRRADFPGAFLRLSEKLSEIQFFEDNKIFTPLQRRRMIDVEFTSELIAILIGGVQNKKESIDNYYQKYQNLDKAEELRLFDQFENTISTIQQIFNNCTLNLGKTRFRQKSDFYSLFAACSDLSNQTEALTTKNWNPLRDDLRILDSYIAPESPIEILSTYAVKCVSGANSASSRLWRTTFLSYFLCPTIASLEPKEQAAAVFAQIRIQIPSDTLNGLGDEAIDENRRPVRFDLFDPIGSEKYWIGWKLGDSPKQMSNMCFLSESHFKTNAEDYVPILSLNQLISEYFDAPDD